MNAERLLAYYERIAEAPDAVARLRRLILRLAVRGHLTRRVDSDDPAFSFDRAIPAEIEFPFAIPKGWRWSRLCALGEIKGGGTPSKARPDFWNGPIPWVSPKDMKCDYLSTAQLGITDDAVRYSPASWIKPNSILFVVRGMILAHSFPVAISRVPLTINQDMKALVLKKPEMAEFLLRALKGVTPEILVRVQRSSHGTCRLDGEDYADFLLPIPPASEQHRIVARVDELMGLCDRLEAARKEREAARDRLAAASLARLGAPNPETFRDDTRFALDHLPALIARSDQIEQLRLTILNLAIRGKLVEQDLDDLPAAELLRAIAATRRSLYADKKIPKPRPLPPIQGDGPFPVPKPWAWSMLGELCYQVADGPHFSPQYVPPGQGVPFLSTRNVRPGKFNLDTVKYVSREDHEKFCERIRPEKGDILYTKGGTTGIAKVNDLDFEFSVWVHLAVLRIDKERLSPRYVEMALNSPHCYEQSQHYTQGISNFDLGLTRMIKITVPVPPLAEQRRIVAKVDELMDLCDQLEAGLAAADDMRARLLESLLHETLSSPEPISDSPDPGRWATAI